MHGAPKPATSGLVVLWLAGCAISVDDSYSPVPGAEHGRTGLVAEPVIDGDLAGTFALVTVNATVIDAPILGQQEGGGVNFRRVVRVADGPFRYRQESTLCGGYNFAVSGVTTSIPERTYRLVPASRDEWVEVDEDGTYRAFGHLQLWALRDLPDPRTTPLPESAAAASMPPHAARIYDLDEDGKPGLTIVVTGLASGEVYAVQRKTVDLEGVVLGRDRAAGLAANVWENLSIGHSNPLLDQGESGTAVNDPDVLKSWFEEVRIGANDTCDDVMRLFERGALGTRPF